MYNSNSEINKLASEVHKGHRKRVIERFVNFGFDSFAEHEVLEMLLFYSIPRKNTNPIAHKLVSQFGSLKNVFNAELSELTKAGLTENSAVLIKAIPELVRIYTTPSVKNLVIDSIEKAKKLFVSKYVNVTVEQIWLACLDSSMRVINCEMICSGDRDSVKINARRIAEIALKYNCCNAFLAHNHPSGQAMVSNEDVASTRNLVSVLRSLDIKLVDHIIVTEKTAISMKEMGHFSVFEM